MRVVWTAFAVESLKGIIQYYKLVANQKVAAKIRQDILLTVKRIKKNPEIGQIELLLKDLNEQSRYALSGHFKIIYDCSEDEIVIVDVFDTRQEPSKMNNPNRR